MANWWNLKEIKSSSAVRDMAIREGMRRYLLNSLEAFLEK
jgi:hypothetical protein